MDANGKKIPAEAVDLYTRFIHGEISCRAFVSGVKGFAVAGLTMGAIINALMPNYALGQQVRPDDERIKATWETIPSPTGNGTIKGYLVRPNSADTRSATPARLPGVLVVHENRGLTSGHLIIPLAKATVTGSFRAIIRPSAENEDILFYSCEISSY